MPFLAPDQNDEQNKKNQESGEGSQASQGQILGGATAPIQGGGQAATATQGSSPKGTSSGAFTNLKAYIGANQGNDAALGGAVKNTVSNAANAATQAGDSFKTNATNAIDAGTIRDDKGLTSKITDVANASASQANPAPGDTRSFNVGTTSGGARTGGFSVGTTNTGARTGGYSVGATKAAPQRSESPAPAGAAAPALTGINADDFSRLFNASYAGPKNTVDLSGYGDTQAAYNRVQGMGQAAGGAQSDMESRKQLLTDTYGTNGQQYRNGEKTLDSFILGAGEGGANALRDINNTYGNYAQNFAGLNDLLGGQIADAAATTEATNRDFRNAVTGAQAALEERLRGARAAAKDRTDAETATLAKLRAGDTNAWSPYTNHAVLDYLAANGGLDGLVSGSTNYSAADMANADDVMNFMALNELLGGAGGTRSDKFSEQDLVKHDNNGINIDLAKIAAGEQGYQKMLAAQQAAEAASPFANAGAYANDTGVSGITTNALQGAYGGGGNGFAGAGVMTKPTPSPSAGASATQAKAGSSSAPSVAGKAASTVAQGVEDLPKQVRPSPLKVRR